MRVSVCVNIYVCEVCEYVCTHNRKRSKETVRVQTEWANGAGRQDAGDEFWEAAASATANPNLEKFKETLAKMDHAASKDGRCEKAFMRWMVKGTWTGSGSYCKNSAFPWIWYA